MENKQNEFHQYVEEFLSNISRYKNGIAHEAERFIKSLYPLWEELNFLIYYEDFEGISDVQRSTDNILLTSEEGEIIFKPRQIYYSTNKENKFEFAAIMTDGDMTDLEGELLGVDEPIIICPWFSKYSLDEIQKREKIDELLVDELYNLCASYLKIITNKHKNAARYLKIPDKTNSKELRSMIEEEIKLFDLLNEKRTNL